MKKRPPLLGYNHNVRHGGRLFHVQTEDSGSSRSCLTTQVFYQGVVLTALREHYEEGEGEIEVRRRMQRQHMAALKQVRDGAFDARVATIKQAGEAGAPGIAAAQEAIAAPAAAVGPAVHLSAPGAAAPVEPDAGAAGAPAGGQPVSALRALLTPLSEQDAMAAVTAPYAPRAKDVSARSEASQLSDQELRELLDLAAATVEDGGFVMSTQSATLDPALEGGQVVEFLAEPAGEDEEPPAPLPKDLPRPGESPSARTPSRTTKPSHRSPRRVPWLGGGSGATPAPRNTETPPIASPALRGRRPLQPEEPTAPRVPLIPRPPSAAGIRALRTTAQRLDAISPGRPQPTAEGVVLQRPVLLVDKERTLGTDPKLAPVSDERNLDQVILAYLAEDLNQKKK